MNAQLTRIQIINEGLAQVGRSDLTSNARLWLNLFLEKVYLVQDWSWLLKITQTALSSPMAVFSDYRGFKGGNLILNGVFQGEITHVWYDEWQAFERGGTTAGNPKYVWVDETNNQFNFWPTPTLNYTFECSYYWTPTLPDPTTNGGDSLIPLWPNLPNDVLIEAIKQKALYYKDDERYQASEKSLMDQIMQAKFNSIDRRGGASKMTMGKSYRRRF